MSGSIELEIPGEPFALLRARATTIRGFARIYDPKENRTWKATAGDWMLRARSEAGILEPFSGAVGLSVTAYFACPRSDERKKPRPERWSLSQKDADNIAKAVGDAGNGILWLDDRQVVALTVLKRIAAQGQPARVAVKAWEIGEEETRAVAAETAPLFEGAA